MRAYRGVMSLENLDEEPIMAAPEVTDFVEAPEQEMLEAETATAEVVRAEDDIGEAADTAQTLETMADRVEESIPEGGMSAPEAEAIEVAVEHMLQRCGYKKGASKMPALENFKSKEKSIAATKVAVESLREKAGALWKAIVDAIQRAIEWIKKLLDFTGRAAAKTVARAEQLKAAAAKSEKPSDAKIKGEKLLVEGYKYLEGAELVGAYRKHVESGVFKSDRLAAASSVFKTVEESLGAKDMAAVEKSLAAVVNEPVKLLDLQAEKGVVVSKPNFSLREGQSAIEVKLEIGNKSLYSVFSTGAKDANVIARLTGFGASHSFIGESSDAKEVKEAPEVKALDGKQVEEVCDLVAGHMKSYEGLSSKISAVESESKSLIGKITALGKDGKDESVAGKLRSAGGVLRGTINILVTGSGALRKFDIQLANTVLSYAAKSISAPATAAKTEPAAAAA